MACGKRRNSVAGPGTGIKSYNGYEYVQPRLNKNGTPDGRFGIKVPLDIQESSKKIQNAKWSRENDGLESQKEKSRSLKKLPKYKAQRNRRNRERLASDPSFKIRKRIRERIRRAMNGQMKHSSSIECLGISVDGLRLHLESLWTSGMSWDNWSMFGWHVDHILPLASFNLTDPEQFNKACHYTNLQPLWWIDNIKKKDKV